MGRHITIAIRMALITVLVFGIMYPLLMTGLAQVMFHKQSNGSLIRKGDAVIGSELIGQQFNGVGYFHPRPSAAGNGYDATASGGSNLGPTSKSFIETVKSRADAEIVQNAGLKPGQIPVDMVTASASGLDPDISVANAYAQAARIAQARRVSEASIKTLIGHHITGRSLGFLGEPSINVLSINIALDALSKAAVK